MKKPLKIFLVFSLLVPAASWALEWQAPLPSMSVTIDPAIEPQLHPQADLFMLPTDAPFISSTHFGKVWYSAHSGIYVTTPEGKLLQWLGAKDGYSLGECVLVEDGKDLWGTCEGGLFKFDPESLKVFPIHHDLYSGHDWAPKALYFYKDYILCAGATFVDLLQRDNSKVTRLIDGLNWSRVATVMGDMIWLDLQIDQKFYSLKVRDLIDHPLHLDQPKSGLEAYHLMVPYGEFPFYDPVQKRNQFNTTPDGVFWEGQKAVRFDRDQKKFVSVPVPTPGKGFDNSAYEKGQEDFQTLFGTLGIPRYYAVLKGRVDQQGHLWLWGPTPNGGRDGLAEFNLEDQSTTFYPAPFGQPGDQKPLPRHAHRTLSSPGGFMSEGLPNNSALMLSGHFVVVDNALWDRVRKKWLLVPLQPWELTVGYGHDDHSFIFILGKTVSVGDGEDGGEETQWTRAVAVDYTTGQTTIKNLDEKTGPSKAFPGFEEDAWLADNGPGFQGDFGKVPPNKLPLPPLPAALAQLDPVPPGTNSILVDREYSYLGSGGEWSWFYVRKANGLVAVHDPAYATQVSQETQYRETEGKWSAWGGTFSPPPDATDPRFFHFQDQMAVAYIDPTDQNRVKVFVNAGKTWEPLGDTGATQGTMQISAVVENGVPYLALGYQDWTPSPQPLKKKSARKSSTQELKVLKYETGHWVQVADGRLTQTGFREFTFAVDQGIPYAATDVFAPGTDMEMDSTVKKFVDGKWEQIGPNINDKANQTHSLCLQVEEGTPYLAFYDYHFSNSAPSTSTRRVVKFDGKAWVGVGEPISPLKASMYVGPLCMAVDQGVPYVAYEDDTHGYKAIVVKCLGGHWVGVGEPDFSPGIVRQLFIAVDKGMPYVAYGNGERSGSPSTVVRLDGRHWAPVGNTDFTPLNTMNFSFDVHGGACYVGYGGADQWGVLYHK